MLLCKLILAVKSNVLPTGQRDVTVQGSKVIVLSQPIPLTQIDHVTEEGLQTLGCTYTSPTVHKENHLCEHIEG